MRAKRVTSKTYPPRQHTPIPAPTPQCINHLAPTVSCASHRFLYRIALASRGSRAVDLTQGGAPGLTNPVWFRGALNTTLLRTQGLKFQLSEKCKALLAARVASWNLVFASQVAFNQWFVNEVTAINAQVRQLSPNSYWHSDTAGNPVVGRSQKLINILLKYCFTAFHSGLFPAFQISHPHIRQVSGLFHAPIDRATVVYLINNLPTPQPSWGSRWQPLKWMNLSQVEYDVIQAAIGNLAATASMSPIHYETVYIW
jgi:hypothetical protein